jgi:uncharacterized membrane protein (DUF4010 family)
LSQSAGGLEISTASRAIVLAVMSNTITKGGIVLLTGSRGLRRTVLPAFILILATGLGVGFLA